MRHRSWNMVCGFLFSKRHCLAYRGFWVKWKQDLLMYDEMIRFWGMKAYEACMAVQHGRHGYVTIQIPMGAQLR